MVGAWIAQVIAHKRERVRCVPLNYSGDSRDVPGAEHGILAPRNAAGRGCHLSWTGQSGSGPRECAADASGRAVLGGLRARQPSEEPRRELVRRRDVRRRPPPERDGARAPKAPCANSTCREPTESPRIHKLIAQDAWEFALYFTSVGRDLIAMRGKG
jgi:hypothetical protein